MTRFVADDPDARRGLIADAVEAHRRRGSDFVTIEVDEADADDPVPWIQYADGVVNLDCTDDELDRLTNLLDDYPSFTVEQMDRPEAAEGTNVRIAARADPDRVAQFVDEAFRRVYGMAEGYAAWAAAV